MASQAWTDHINGVNGLLDAQRQRIAAARAAAAAATPTPTTTPVVTPTAPSGFVETWQGGANTGDFGPQGSAGDLSGLLGNIGAGQIGGWGGALAGSLLGGPFGGLLGAVGGRALGNLFGGQTAGPQAQPTAAGIGSLGGENFGGGPGPETFGGGLGSMGTAGMGLGLGDLGAMTGQEIMGWQQGGYTGAGRDGVVQPSRPAGVVHEGEFVIPAHMVRKMGLLRR